MESGISLDEDLIQFLRFLKKVFYGCVKVIGIVTKVLGEISLGIHIDRQNPESLQGKIAGSIGRGRGFSAAAFLDNERDNLGHKNPFFKNTSENM